jgi:hypothetical protein
MCHSLPPSLTLKTAVTTEAVEPEIGTAKLLFIDKLIAFVLVRQPPGRMVDMEMLTLVRQINSPEETCIRSQKKIKKKIKIKK